MAADVNELSVTAPRPEHCVHRRSFREQCPESAVTSRSVRRKDGAEVRIALCAHHVGLEDLMAACSARSNSVNFQGGS